MKERLTQRKHDFVLFRKDGQLIPPMNMSGQEIRMVMERLCEYEDEAELKERAKICFTEDCSYQTGNPCEAAEGCGGFEGAEESFLMQRFMKVE